MKISCFIIALKHPHPEAGDVTQLVECLFSMNEALSSIPAQKEKNNHVLDFKRERNM